MAIKEVMVIGAGQMGSGIAQVCAMHGLEVALQDIAPEFVARGFSRIEESLARIVKKGGLSESASRETLARITQTTSLDAVASADLVIEAAVEKMDIKKSLFMQLDGLAKSDAILATNTSSLPITEIAAVTSRPERVIGMHFMNPVPVMKLVEVIRGLQTSEETYRAVSDLARTLGKTPVEVHDYPGFISNRILLPMINEAIYCLYEGVADRDAIDTVMKLGMNHPMGPLQLADFIGLDTCLSIMEILHEGLGDSKYRPCPLLRKYVAAGWLGKKSGRGFYDYRVEAK